MKHKKIIFPIIGIILVCLTIFAYSSWLEQTDYWGSAPDGTYLVFVSGEIENHQLWLPICAESGGNLHGNWAVANNVTYPDTIKWFNETNAIIDLYQNGTAIYGPRSYRFGYAMATLKNNVITDLTSDVAVSETKVSWPPFDLVPVLPYILIGAVIAAFVAFLWTWFTQKSMDNTNDYSALNNTEQTEESK